MRSRQDLHVPSGYPTRQLICLGDREGLPSPFAVGPQTLVADPGWQGGLVRVFRRVVKGCGGMQSLHWQPLTAQECHELGVVVAPEGPRGPGNFPRGTIVVRRHQSDVVDHGTDGDPYLLAFSSTHTICTVSAPAPSASPRSAVTYATVPGGRPGRIPIYLVGLQDLPDPNTLPLDAVAVVCEQEHYYVVYETERTSTGVCWKRRAAVHLAHQGVERLAAHGLVLSDASNVFQSLHDVDPGTVVFDASSQQFYVRANRVGTGQGSLFRPVDSGQAVEPGADPDAGHAAPAVPVGASEVDTSWLPALPSAMSAERGTYAWDPVTRRPVVAAWIDGRMVWDPILSIQDPKAICAPALVPLWFKGQLRHVAVSPQQGPIPLRMGIALPAPSNVAVGDVFWWVRSDRIDAVERVAAGHWSTLHVVWRDESSVPGHVAPVAGTAVAASSGAPHPAPDVDEAQFPLIGSIDALPDAASVASGTFLIDPARNELMRAVRDHVDAPTRWVVVARPQAGGAMHGHPATGIEFATVNGRAVPTVSLAAIFVGSPSRSPHAPAVPAASAVDLGAELTDSAVRVAGRQLVRLVRAPLLAALGRRDAGLAAAVGDFLATDGGGAVLGAALSAALLAAPDAVGPYADVLARELRVAALATGGDLLADLITGPLRALVAQGLLPAAAPAPPELTSGARWPSFVETATTGDHVATGDQTHEG